MVVLYASSGGNSCTSRMGVDGREELTGASPFSSPDSEEAGGVFTGTRDGVSMSTRLKGHSNQSVLYVNRWSFDYDMITIRGTYFFFLAI